MDILSPIFRVTEFGTGVKIQKTVTENARLYAA
jgi:hypothetical protein